MKLIIIYGPPAAGKLTIARVLAEQLDFKLFHNHLTADLVKAFFPFASEDYLQLSQKIRLDTLAYAAQKGISGVIMTLVYARDTVDDIFIKRFIERMESSDVEMIFVRIQCDTDVLLERVTAESRKQFRKLRSQEGLLQSLATYDLTSLIAGVESVTVNSTHLTADETVAQVLTLIQDRL